MDSTPRALTLLRALRRLPERLRRWQSVPWDEPGPGAVIPFLPGGREVPQGLAHDAASGELVYTFYEGHDPKKGLIVFADESGAVTARVPLEGLDHYGGVTVLGERTYVCGGGRVQVYETARLRAGFGEPLATVRVRASSTITSHRGDLYVSRFRTDEPGVMYRYEIGAEGLPARIGDELVAPPRTQGVAFDGDQAVYFSRSWGRATPSVLTRVCAEDLWTDGGWTPENGHDTLLPPMAEGSVIIGRRLHQLYESGAATYRRHPWPHPVRQVLVGRLDPRGRLTVHRL